MTALERGRPPGAIASIDLNDGRHIEGFLDEAYEQVLDAFATNFTERHDLGAGCAAYVGGRVVVNLWGGIADARTGRPWREDTAAVIFSCSKGLMTIGAYLLVQEGRLDLDSPVGRYWPEFVRHGKESITVRSVLSHRAGLPALDRDLSLDEAIAGRPVVEAIEEQAPLWEPGAAHMYHAMTVGWIIGEVIRRITGLSAGAYFQAVLGKPLALATWIGLPAGERERVAWMEPPLPDEDSDAAREAARVSAENEVVARSLTMGGAFPFPASNGVVSFNSPAIQAAEIPAANGIATPASLARLYAACVSRLDDLGPLLSHQSIADATVVRSAGRQWSRLPDDGSSWGTGFQLASPPSQPMLGPKSFGHSGAGGQLAFADAEFGAGFAYLSNQMGGYGDARASSLTRALASSLRSQRAGALPGRKA